MLQFDLALTIIAGMVLVVGTFSHVLKRSPVQEPLVSVGVGIAVGPYALGWLDLESWGPPHALLEHVAELTLAISLMAVALRLSADDLRRLWRPMVWLLTAGMLGMWIISSTSAAWLLGLPLWSAAVLGAAITPTDPVVASSIVTGQFARQSLPRRIRSSLSLESGANDGLAYLFVMLPVLMLQSTAEPWRHWLVQTLLQGVVLAAIVGALLGYAAGRILHWAERSDLIERYSFLTFTTTLSLFTLGAASLIHADALISVFTAGIVFTLTSDTSERHEEERIQESMSKLFTLPMFTLFGLALPFAAWARLGWPLAGLVVAVLLLRRIPVIAVLLPALRHTYGSRDASYIAWFGPIGVAAVYYALFAARETGQPLIWEIASAVVLGSIVLHGITAAPLTRMYSHGGPRCATRQTA